MYIVSSSVDKKQTRQQIHKIVNKAWKSQTKLTARKQKQLTIE